MTSYGENVPGRVQGSFLAHMKVFSEEDPVPAVMSPTYPNALPLICPQSPCHVLHFFTWVFLSMSSSPSVQPLWPLAWTGESLAMGLCLLGPPTRPSYTRGSSLKTPLPAKTLNGYFMTLRNCCNFLGKWWYYSFILFCFYFFKKRVLIFQRHILKFTEEGI